MVRTIGAGLLLGLIAVPQLSETKTAVWTGWFSDKQCARIRANEAPRPNGTVCVKKCLDEGSPAVFISEQARAIYDVRDYEAVKDNIGYYVRIRGDVDETAKTVSIQSVERISEVTAMCLLPKRGEKK